VQRRHQKVLEEAPAPGMTPTRRAAMGDAAVAAARAIGYVGAGTVEFIADPDGTFYFMEMNTRLQVEHPVTEMITGQDLVEWQLHVAQGEPLPRAQHELAIDGHALEARIYAEDPARDFLPSIGHIAHWQMPAASANVRVDTGFRAGDDVSPYYDPMLAKLIVHGRDRAAACALMQAALAQCVVAGVATNLGLLERVVAHPAFASGDVDTGLIPRHREALLAPDQASATAVIAAAMHDLQALGVATTTVARAGGDPWSPWQATDAWWAGSAAHRVTFVYRDGATTWPVTLAPGADGHVAVTLGDRTVDAHAGDGDGTITIAGVRTHVGVVAVGAVRHVVGDGVRARITLDDPYAVIADEDDTGGHLHAPMSGTIVAVLVKAGDAVVRGAPLVVLEAMKMEHTIAAPVDGTVAAVNCAMGERVAEGFDLVDFTPAA
jgi:3-methylcrotonyl-CoA carboxylase alpha subunit